MPQMNDPEERESLQITVVSLDNEPDAQAKRKPRLTIYDLGWTREEALLTRGAYGAAIEDWDDPMMNAYDAL